VTSFVTPITLFDPIQFASSSYSTGWPKKWTFCTP